MEDHLPWRRLEKIGVGSFGAVYKAVHKQTNQIAAIKILSVDASEEDVADIRREIALLSQLKQGDAQNVTRYHGSILCGEKLWIIMDYCHGGSIRTLMKSGRFEERYCAIIIREVLLALGYIHKCGIIHRDVKAANILVANDGSVQLCDFGVATQLAANHLKRSTFVGTPYWMAPEVITEGSSYNSKADIWSLGITLYEIATGNPPFADQEPMRAIIMIPRSQPARLESNTYSTNMKDFVSSCLRESPNERPAAEELSKMKFIKQVSKLPTSSLQDLIVKFERWQESGGVRKSLLVHNRRSSALSDLKIDLLDDDEPVGWDFDTVKSYMKLNNAKSPHLEPDIETSPLMSESNLISQVSSERQATHDTPNTKIGREPSPFPTVSNSNSSTLHTNNITTQSEHRLMQLFEDPSRTQAHGPPMGYSSRKNTLPSRPGSPSQLAIPPYPGSLTQPSSPIIDSHSLSVSSISSSALRLPEIAPSEPLQIEIPTPEETLKMDGYRSRSNTVSTRANRSNSVTQFATPTTRLFRTRSQLDNTNTSPPRSIRAPSPTRPALISPLNPPSKGSSLASPSSSPPKEPLPSLSATNFNPSFVAMSTAERNRASPLKVSNLSSKSSSPLPPLHRDTIGTLVKTRLGGTNGKLPGTTPQLSQLSTQHLDTKGTGMLLSPVRTYSSAPATIPAQLPDQNTQLTLTSDLYQLPPLAPLNLDVLTEPATPVGNGMVASKILTDEVDRVLKGFGTWMDMVGRGLEDMERSIEKNPALRASK